MRTRVTLAFAVALLVPSVVFGQPEPTDAVGFVKRGDQRYEKGEYEKAIKDYDAAIELDPKNAGVFARRGAARSHQQKFDDAIADLTEAIRLDPKLAFAHAERGYVRLFQNQWEGALTDLDTALRLDEKHAHARAARGLLRAACADGKFRDAKRAVADAKKACELTGWKEGYALEAYAAACAEAGDFAEAVKWQKKVLEDADYVALQDSGPKGRLELYEAKKPYRLLPEMPCQ